MLLEHRAVLLAACLTTAFASLSQAAQTPGPTPPAKTPITHEKLWLMKRVGKPDVSPDGRWAVFPVVEPSYEPDKELSDLWLVATDGSSPPRRLTRTRATEG